MPTHHRPACSVLILITALLIPGCTKSRPPEGGPATAPAPPIIPPTQWGAPASGLRLGIATDGTRFSVGQRIHLSAAARNVGDRPLLLRAPAAEPDVTFRQDLITLTYRLDATRRLTLPQGEAWTGALSGPLSLAPGMYRLRVAFTADELPASQLPDGLPAWHGEVRSNEVTIEVAPSAP